MHIMLDYYNHTANDIMQIRIFQSALTSYTEHSSVMRSYVLPHYDLIKIQGQQR